MLISSYIARNLFAVCIFAHFTNDFGYPKTMHKRTVFWYESKCLLHSFEVLIIQDENGGSIDKEIGETWALQSQVHLFDTREIRIII